MTDTPDPREPVGFHAQVLNLVEIIVQDFVNSRTNTSTLGDASRPTIETLNIVREQYNVSGTAGAVGPAATFQGNLLAQAWSQCSFGEDQLGVLSEELVRLAEALKGESEHSDIDATMGAIAAAESAARRGDGPTVFNHLRNAGRWCLGIAEKLAVPLATEALRRALSL
jgi:hypothetical protein